MPNFKNLESASDALQILRLAAETLSALPQDNIYVHESASLIAKRVGSAVEDTFVEPDQNTVDRIVEASKSGILDQQSAPSSMEAFWNQYIISSLNRRGPNP